jgi:hypothetical protein
VVVGGNQALRRHERGRATAQADDGAHRELGQFGQGGGIEFQAGGFQLLGYLWQLLRHPHAFIGIGGGAQDGERDQGFCIFIPEGWRAKYRQNLRARQLEFLPGRPPRCF